MTRHITKAYLRLPQILPLNIAWLSRHNFNQSQLATSYHAFRDELSLYTLFFMTSSNILLTNQLSTFTVTSSLRNLNEPIMFHFRCDHCHFRSISHVHLYFEEVLRRCPHLLKKWGGAEGAPPQHLLKQARTAPILLLPFQNPGSATGHTRASVEYFKAKIESN